MDKKIKELAGIFTQINDNWNTYGDQWKNLKLVKDAFEMLKALPLDYDEEVSAANRITVLQSMMGCVSETDIPRFSLSVREYQLSLYGQLKDGTEVCETPRSDVEASAARLRDYLNPRIKMEDWCRKYGRMLKFDDVERSEAWENCIYDVEAECDRRLAHERKGMGFCFSYWSTKASVLAKHGIDWRNPHIMNPRVMFD